MQEKEGDYKGTYLKYLCENPKFPQKKLSNFQNKYGNSTDSKNHTSSMDKQKIREFEVHHAKQSVAAVTNAAETDLFSYDKHKPNTYHKTRKCETDAWTSGGDADRFLSDNFPQRWVDNFSMNNEAYFPLSKSQYSQKASTINSTGSPICKHHQVAMGVKPAPDEAGGYQRYMCGNDSILGGVCNGSEGSEKSRISSKTVVSRKSSHELRKIVKSQCKLHDEIGETLKQLSNSGGFEKERCRQKETSAMDIPIALSHCKRCPEKLQSHPSNKDVMTEMGSGDFPECHSTDTLTITMDDVVNSKVINPMIRKLQRMYLNNLKEEMSLMEDLERLPHKVNEVYKATIFQRKD